MGLRVLCAPKVLLAPILAFGLLAVLYLPNIFWDTEWPATVLHVPLLGLSKQQHEDPPAPIPPPPPIRLPPEIVAINKTAHYFVEYPLSPPYREVFGELGRRAQILREWLKLAERMSGPKQVVVADAVERAAAALFPFLQNGTTNNGSLTPLADLRRRIQPESKGIVIPAGKHTMRYACHLVGALRAVLKTELPIEIVYVGDGDLPPDKRWMLQSLSGNAPISFLDITTVFDEPRLRLFFGGWAIKPFAVLASRFEQVILLDADAVFLQPPDVLFRQKAYLTKGALLFHDRLVWHPSSQERHEWWASQIRRPGPEMAKSLVWKGGYAEEQDSGVVVVDKSRLDVLVGLLHVAWQNTFEVREEVTYQLMYGDKESWWLGFEFVGSTYEFEKHYGGIVGWPVPDANGKNASICSFLIAHTDERDLLLWYNGSLLKNKSTDPKTYGQPEEWVVDGTWEMGIGQNMSCVSGGQPKTLTLLEKSVLERSILMAQHIDKQIGF